MKHWLFYPIICQELFNSLHQQKSGNAVIILSDCLSLTLLFIASRKIERCRVDFVLLDQKDQDFYELHEENSGHEWKCQMKYVLNWYVYLHGRVSTYAFIRYIKKNFYLLRWFFLIVCQKFISLTIIRICWDDFVLLLSLTLLFIALRNQNSPRWLCFQIYILIVWSST